MKEFLKKAFCIDGEISDGKVCDITVNGNTIKGGLFILEDSKRGKFTVVVSYSIHKTQ